VAEPNKSGLDKTPSMSGDGSKIRTPMKDYKAKGNNSKGGNRGKK